MFAVFPNPQLDPTAIFMYFDDAESWAKRKNVKFSIEPIVVNTQTVYPTHPSDTDIEPETP